MQTRSIRFAGFWIRAVAFLIDLVLLNFVSWLLELVLLGSVYWVARWSGHPLPAERGLDSMLDPMLEQVISVALFLAVSAAYFIYGYSVYGTSLGKKAFGLRVVRSGTYGPIGAAQASLRFVGYAISWISMGAGFLMAALNRQKRGLHDWIAGTVVIRPDRPDKRSGAGATPSGPMPTSGPPGK